MASERSLYGMPQGMGEVDLGEALEIEIEAPDAVIAEEVALLTDLDKWDDERLENSDGLSIDDVEEVKNA